MTDTLRTILQRIVRWGVTPADSADQLTRKGILNVAATLVSCVFILVIGPFYIAFQEPVVGLAYMVVGAFITRGLAFAQQLWGNYDRLLFTISLLVLPVHLIIYVLLGGFVESGGILLWGLAHPVMSNLVLYGPRPTLRWFALYIINFLHGM